MRWRAGAVVISLALTAPVAAAPEAQQSKKLPLVVYVTIAPSTQIEAFKLGLQELSYVEGRNITIESRYYERFDRLAEVAAEVIRLKPTSSSLRLPPRRRPPTRRLVRSRSSSRESPIRWVLASPRASRTPEETSLACQPSTSS